MLVTPLEHLWRRLLHRLVGVGPPPRCGTSGDCGEASLPADKPVRNSADDLAVCGCSCKTTVPSLNTCCSAARNEGIPSSCSFDITWGTNHRRAPGPREFTETNSIPAYFARVRAHKHREARLGAVRTRHIGCHCGLGVARAVTHTFRQELHDCGLHGVDAGLDDSLLQLHGLQYRTHFMHHLQQALRLGSTLCGIRQSQGFRCESWCTR